jgi:hypothetical protein
MKVKSPSVLICDVDGVLTNGQFVYTSEGKFSKVFGPDDHDALTLLRPYIEIRFVTGDKKGFDISARRIIDDMHYGNPPLEPRGLEVEFFPKEEVLHEKVKIYR